MRRKAYTDDLKRLFLVAIVKEKQRASRSACTVADSARRSRAPQVTSYWRLPPYLLPRTLLLSREDNNIQLAFPHSISY